MSGLKLTILRDEDAAGPPFVYEGDVIVRETRFAVVARVDASAADVRLPEGIDEKAARLTRALVRAATKAALTSGEAPPRKIVRWRAID